LHCSIGTGSTTAGNQGLDVEKTSRIGYDAVIDMIGAEFWKRIFWNCRTE
jgi:hypothetical protein